MVRKKTNENQPPLPLGIEPTANRHDYGGQYDSGDFGHEFPFVQEIARKPEDGVSVSLKDRYKTIADAAKVYAKYNSRTIGLGKAAQIPEERAKLDKRYGAANVDRVVAGARNNSSYSAAGGELDFDNPSDEQTMLEGVLKTKELIAAGFDPTEVAAEIQPMIVGLRRVLATKEHGVDASVRDEEVKKIKATADRADEYKD